MRIHESLQEATSFTKSRSLPRGVPAAPRRLTNLQPVVGNAAVARAVATHRIDRKRAPYQKDVPLQWKDFRGAVPKQTAMSASTASGWLGGWSPQGVVAFERSPRVRGQRRTYVATATLNLSSIDIRSFFDTSKSWTKGHEQTPQLLAHERGHFGITQVIGEKTEVALKQLDSSASAEAYTRKLAARRAVAAVRSPLQATFASGWKGAETAQHRYDGSSKVGTDHGLRRPQQDRWNRWIQLGLPSFVVNPRHD